ncbi:MAG: hypothetical protein HFE43_09475 [Oscillospiraceae bacterium]|nr:hypothetical protein [Oscillospiraceae bacterium]
MHSKEKSGGILCGFRAFLTPSVRKKRLSGAAPGDFEQALIQKAAARSFAGGAAAFLPMVSPMGWLSGRIAADACGKIPGLRFNSSHILRLLQPPQTRKGVCNTSSMFPPHRNYTHREMEISGAANQGKCTKSPVLEEAILWKPENIRMECINMRNSLDFFRNSCIIFINNLTGMVMKHG